MSKLLKYSKQNIISAKSRIKSTLKVKANKLSINFPQSTHARANSKVFDTNKETYHKLQKNDSSNIWGVMNSSSEANTPIWNKLVNLTL